MHKSNMSSDLAKLEAKIKMKFKDITLLQNVFIHRSYLNEHKELKLASNEKLEFLGDSVLSLITSAYLFKHYSGLDEGISTDIKSSIVRTESLAQAARDLILGEFLFLSKGEERGGGKSNTHILADCFEALIAAIFLDRGFDKAYVFVKVYLFQDRLAAIIENNLYESPKSKLQELMQRTHKKIPVYKVLKEEGPEHKRTFTVGVFFESKKLGVASGRSKKEAEELAARQALTSMI